MAKYPPAQGRKTAERAEEAREASKSGSSSDMSIKVKDYQPGEAEFAGKLMGTANEYVARKTKESVSEASKIKSNAWKGRYD